MSLFNNRKKPIKLRLGYGTAKKARKSIKSLRHKSRQYQLQAAQTMYYRAKYHKYQTKGMRNAQKIYRKFLQTLKRKRT